MNHRYKCQVKTIRLSEEEKNLYNLEVSENFFNKTQKSKTIKNKWIEDFQNGKDLHFKTSLKKHRNVGSIYNIIYIISILPTLSHIYLYLSIYV